MKNFLGEDFLLENTTAEQLYHGFASSMPIMDYHCHLSPKDIAENRQFNHITDAWLEGDHYKWRAMRTFGIDESFITGSKSPESKFKEWAKVVPFTIRNPLYHWTHLELQRYFGIHDLLSPDTAEKIYQSTREKLSQPELSTQGILQKMNVKMVGTTDDPADDLAHHQSIKKQNLKVVVAPTFRPDKAYNFTDVNGYHTYLEKLEKAGGQSIKNLSDLLEVLFKRIEYFHENGARLADHGLEYLPGAQKIEGNADHLFDRVIQKRSLSAQEQEHLAYVILVELCKKYHQMGWTQQFHLGALRNNNKRFFRELGPDTGFDSMGDFSQARNLSAFLSTLDEENQLARTVLYNLNPADNELFATMVGNFNDGSMKAKVQFGSGWWFLDQKDGMERQLNALSNMGLLSCFVGMLTDSRSFLSFPRHEYFRRILCNLIAKDVENGELPNDIPLLGSIVQDICFNNAKNYFNVAIHD
ncbi:glucuronate isomerase [Marivirga lumbricoides]|uniref:Uronate isomerase n=1 Tax=Marivirga lumbricoides TaxID=1046115 RepID=A0A2T4DT75_9BACT|nr:glucuronate isomerase [Marivirga lumbricoides]